MRVLDVRPGCLAANFGLRNVVRVSEAAYGQYYLDRTDPFFFFVFEFIVPASGYKTFQDRFRNDRRKTIRVAHAQHGNTLEGQNMRRRDTCHLTVNPQVEWIP